MPGVVRGWSVTALLLIVANVAVSARAREWVDTTGNFRVEAELVEVTETHVRVLTKAGKTLTVPIARLSEVDRQYLKWKQLENSVSAEDKLAAKKLVEQAMVLFDVDPRGNAAQIDRKLREAGKLNPADIRAEFLCGVFNLVVSADPDKAERNFTTCLARKPGDVGVLSNLALSQVKGGKHGSAIKTFAEAAKAGPGLLAITQNLGRAMKVHNDGRLKMPVEMADQFADLYATLVADKDFPASRPQLGWLIVNLDFSEFVDTDVDEDAPSEEEESDEDEDEETDDDEELNSDLPANVVAGGTGFVVQGDYIVTNRHVVGKKKEVVIRVPGRDAISGLLNAKVIAVSKEADMAVVHCPKLGLPAVDIVAELPRRGSDVMVLGFPQFSQLGASIKSTRGAVTSLPAPETDNLMLLDAEMNSGNSGGPVANRRGQIVAVATAVFAPVGGTGGKYGAGLPIGAHLKFMQRHIPNLAASAAKDVDLDWPDVDELISRSTVLVLLVGDEAEEEDEPKKVEPKVVSRGMMLDPTCPTCSGSKHRRGRPGQACPTCGGLGLDREVVLHLAEFKSRFSGGFEDEEEDEDVEEEMEDDTEFGDTGDDSDDAADSFLQPYDGPPIDQGRTVPKIVHAPSSGGFAEGRFERGGGIEYVEAEGRALNLISLIDRRDFRPAEKWRVAGGKLECVEGHLVPKVVFPINVPEEYDLQVVVTQHAMRNGVGLIVPNGHGQSLAWMIGGTGGSETSLSMGDKYPQLAAGDRMFKEEVPYDCVLCVRRERLEGYINGKRVFCYHGNRKPLVTNVWHRSPDPDRIAVSCDDPATFHMVRFVEIK